ncbi:hypothetical protein [Taibaiella soli]|uniref:Uncharacterized protein n=1 Tax=Taibaiella soli TaxID=1649169 RepID=A0A2W2BG04_9BACT|nr:hypothetical protein [Taibaiella soli]PZF74847.1 hypothetical protein DN068_01225 [Taibaiella soli]
MDFFKEFLKIKYYILAVLAAVTVFVWSGYSGTRIWGDGLDSKEVHGGPGGGSRGFYHSHFYHK